MTEKLKITAIDGKEYFKNECRKIKGLYYKIGDIKIIDSGQCYFVNGKYYKSDTGYIVYDHKKQEYVIKNLDLLVENGIVAIKNEEPIFGYFSHEKGEHPIILNYKNSRYVCLNEDIFKNSFIFKESLSSGEYHDRKAIRSTAFTEPVPCNNGFKNNLLYDSKDILKNHIKEYNRLYKPNISSLITHNSSVVKNYTFGLEFETCKGMVPTRILNKLGIIPLRDGSIAGLEFVTIPLQGKKGLQTIIDVCNELQLRTRYDTDCAFHIHIGGIPRTESFILALCRILSIVEDEMYKMFPIYKRDNFGVKKKSYSKPFPFVSLFMKMDKIINESNITSNFKVLFDYLSMGVEYPGDISYVTHHPSDPSGTAKWNIKTRYHWFNLIPLLFGNKQTVEFRIHTSTYDYNKIINFLIICIALIDEAVVNEVGILENNVEYSKINNILYQYFKRIDASSSIYESINYYIDTRKNYIARCINDKDIIADEDNLYYSPLIDWNDEVTSIQHPKSSNGLQMLNLIEVPMDFNQIVLEAKKQLNKANIVPKNKNLVQAIENVQIQNVDEDLNIGNDIHF